MVQRIMLTSFSAFAVALLGLAAISQARHPPIVSVRWLDDVTLLARTELEERFTLSSPRLHEDDPQTLTYSISDTSRGNLRALVAHPDVSDTAGIERASARLETDSSLWAHAVRSASRALLLGLLVGATLTLWVLFNHEETALREDKS